MTRNELIKTIIPIALFGGCFMVSLNNSSACSLQDEKDNYDVVFYHLDLQISDSSTYISGSTSIFVKSVSDLLDQVVFDMSSNLVTDSVTSDNQLLQFNHEQDKLRVDLKNGLTIGEMTGVKIYYHGLGSVSGEVSGIYNRYSSSWNKYITWTLSEPFSALNWFPCKQSLTDKADSVYVFLTTDENLKAGSNGKLTSKVVLPGDRVRYEWKSKLPIAYYLISFTVSDYMDYSFYAKGPHISDSILIQNYVYNDSSYLAQNQVSIGKTSDLIELYSELFGAYPFASEKYGHCVAPFSGGMEHQTMTTIVNFSFLLVAHELAHQWFGDFVTCATWQDIWINEGFASYAEYLANEFLRSQDEANIWITACNDYVKSSPDGSVFVPESLAENEDRIFDSRLSYKKGASVIHMIRQEVGNDSLFFDILATFLVKHKFGNVTGNDFKNHVEDKTGNDFGQFFDQWYYGQGYPIHSVRWEHRNDTLYINSLQTVSSETPFFNVLLEFKVTYNNKDTLIALRQNAGFSQWEIYLPGNVTSVQADPNHWLLTDLSDINIIPQVNTDSGFRIIPNPARDEIRILFDEPPGNYTIFLANAEGKIIETRVSNSQSEDFNIQSCPPGMYFVIIKNGKISRQGKFIIN